jgi:hypothetical protein
VDMRLSRYVASGAMSIAQEILRPPTKAYSRLDVPGKISVER